MKGEIAMGNLTIKTCVLGSVSTNCYLVYNEGGQAVIIDPADDAPYLLNLCQEMGITPAAIMLTHGHFDHILATHNLQKQLDIPVYAGEAELELLENPRLNLSSSFGDSYSMTTEHLMKDGQELELLGQTWKVLDTPGHTAGSVCYLLEKEGVLFSGDTLFEESLGRTDLPTSSSSAIIASITRKLFALPDDTVVYPGHGNPTTIAHEKQYNPAAHYNKR